MALFVLGFCSLPAQVILLREFLLLFSGNELLIGVFLAIWMWFTGLGSAMGRWHKLSPSLAVWWLAVLLWLPLVLLAAMDLLRNRIFLPGVEPGISGLLMLLTLILLPFGFLSGLLFASLAQALPSTGKRQAGSLAYGTESWGSMTGVALFSLVLVYLRDDYRAAVILAITGSVMVFLLCRSRIRQGVLILSFLGIVTAFLLVNPVSSFFRQYLFQKQKLLHVLDTPSGNLAVTQISGQLNVFENHTLLYSSQNQQSAEEAVHFAMVQANNPRRVLLISGGLAGLTREILKYTSVNHVDYFEIDPFIIQLAKRIMPDLANPAIQAVQDDPRIFLRESDRQYDAILVYLPAPSSIQINRYYSAEFIDLVKSHLYPGGVFSFSLPLTENYMNEGEVTLYSSLLNTCKARFAHTDIFPGLAGYFVASDRNINIDIGQLTDDKKINNDYVNSYFLLPADLHRRMNRLREQLVPNTRMNTDMNPVALTGYYRFWFKRFHMDFRHYRTLALTVFLIILMLASFSPPRYSAVFYAGFGSSSLQIILLLSLQIVYGYIYSMIGLFMAVFMGALALGTVTGDRLLRRNEIRYLFVLPWGLTACALTLPFLIRFSFSLVRFPWVIHGVYLAATALVAIITGMVFTAASGAAKPDTKSFLPFIYGADLAGASLGALFTSLLLIPLAGISGAPLLIALVTAGFALSIPIRQIFGNLRKKIAESP